ncbi:hypothetical protein Tco_1503930 [Tanacetum coccineum]
MDLKWWVAMISMRLKKFYKKTGRKLQFDAKEPVGFDKTKVEFYNCHKTGHFAREYRSKGNQDSMRRDVGYTGYKAKDNGRRPRKQEEPKALVTLDGGGSDTEVNSCSKECKESYAKLKKLYDEQREQLGDASIEIQAYTQALKKVEAQLVAHQQNQLWYEEKIRFMKIDLDDKTDVLIYHKKLLVEAKKEKEELKAKVEKSHNSSKGLNILLNNQMSARDKAGLGYGNQMHKGILSYEIEVFGSVFDSRSSDIEDSPVNDRYAKGMHDVPPPMIGIYIPSVPDVEIDESHVEINESVPKLVANEPKAVSDLKVWSDAPIIKEYESDSDNEHVSLPTKEQETPSFAFVNTKRMAKEVELNKKKGKGTVQSENKPFWNNVHRLNHQNKFVPIVVLTRTSRFSINTANQAASTSTARKVNTVRSIVNEIRPRNNFFKSHSPTRRPFYKTTAPKDNFLNHKVKTAGGKTVSAVGGIRETAVKTSADCNWRSKIPYKNKVSKYNSGSKTSKNVDDPQKALKNKGIIDSAAWIGIKGYKWELTNLVLPGKFGAATQIWCCHVNLVLSGKFDAVRQIWCCQENLVLPGKISMANLEFVDQHNMVACLEKTEGNSDFHEIVDFLASSSIHHALTVSPPIYTSYIEQFWNTASSQTVNDVKQINATVDSKAVVVTEASIRSSLLFNDADGTACLTNEAIFQNLALMGYEGDFNKLTFQKALFSPQWKFLIHTILHCLSSKSTSWNEFSTNIASAVICLATNQKFNFSKLIFDGMLRNLDNTKKKFLMYPRFLMVFLNNQIELGEPFNDVYPTPAHNLKVFTNMSRKGLKFSGKITPLFPNMLTHAAEGEGSGEPTEPQPTPSPTQPSIGDQPPRIYSRDSLEGTNGNKGDQVQTPHDSPFSGGHTSDRVEGALNLQELSVFYTNLSNRILALESIKDAKAAEISALTSRIKKLEKKCNPSISHHRAWLKSVNILSINKRFGKKESVSKQGRKKSKPESTLDDSTVFDDQNADHGMKYMETEEAVDKGRQSGETGEVKLTDDTGVVEDKGSDIDAARQEDSVVEPRTPPTTTSIFDDEDITMAQTLIKMKEEKAKEKGVSIKDVDDSSRPARSILTLKPLPTIDPKDRGKGVSKESPVKKVKRSDLEAAQIAKDTKIARPVHEKELAEMEREREERQRQDQASVDYIASLYDEVQAKMDASEERKKLLVEERVAAVRNKLPTRTQLRSLMMTYLKHTGKYRHNQLNKKTFEDIQALYIKEQERDADFVPIGSERDEKMIDKMNKKAAGMDEEEVPEEPEKNPENTKLSLKIVPDEEEEIDYEVLGTRYPIVNWESAFYHTDRYGVPHDYYRVFRANGSSRYIKTFTEMVSRFDRLDFIELHSLVMQRFSTTTPKGIDLVLWGDLRIMFEETANDDIWKNQEKWIIKSWTFYENYGVHILALEDGTEIHMLAERRYPLIRETLERMMELRLTVESEGEVVFDLLRFISLEAKMGVRRIFECCAPCYSNEALAIPEQTTTGKEISNPFMAGSLPKTT